ncbi:MAG: 16S rRNA (cytidine(1402)-2'-O)-methyltransferase [Anaerolineae bacterium]|nr:16S rRNA (cytidine(1402)-2'-O)-methyltransferase [Anaerolineae bacterium]
MLLPGRPGEVGTLYVVATPIGNLEDITLRALRILSEVDLIAAEDTRTTRKLLTHYGIKTPLTSYWEHNKLVKLHSILDTLAERDVALVSKAGMPGISDPGYELIRAALEKGYGVVPVPGPSAPVAALVASGFPTDSFVYLGFLPRKAGQRRSLLASLDGETRTVVAFEAPHRLLAALEDITEALGERQVAVARELTKLHEEVVRGTSAEVLDHFRKHPPRGEVTLVIGGATEAAWGQKRVEQALRRLGSEGKTGSRAVKEVARLSRRPRAEVYDIWLGMEDE